jgi:hypothetical protein
VSSIPFVCMAPVGGSFAIKKRTRQSNEEDEGRPGMHARHGQSPSLISVLPSELAKKLVAPLLHATSVFTVPPACNCITSPSLGGKSKWPWNHHCSKVALLSGETGRLSYGNVSPVTLNPYIEGCQSAMCAYEGTASSAATTREIIIVSIMNYMR